MGDCGGRESRLARDRHRGVRAQALPGLRQADGQAQLAGRARTVLPGDVTAGAVELRQRQVGPGQAQAGLDPGAREREPAPALELQAERILLQRLEALINPQTVSGNRYSDQANREVDTEVY